MSFEWCFGLIATYLIHSTILLGVCWLVLRLHRSATPAFESRVWKFAATAGFLTALAQTSLPRLAADGLGDHSVVRFGDFATWHLAVDRSNEVKREAPIGPAASLALRREGPRSSWTVSTSVEPIQMPASNRVVKSQPRERAFRQTNAVPKPAAVEVKSGAGAMIPRRFAVIAALIWAGCGLSWFAHRLSRSHRRVRAMPLATSDRLLGVLAELKQKVQPRRPVDLRIDQNLDAQPIAIGCFRWTIVLPGAIADVLDDEELRSVLSHEFAHLVRRDYAWKLVGNLLCGCAGFQPLNFLARRRWERASEYLSDQWATDHGASRLALAKTLTRLAELRHAPSPLVGVAATGSKPMLVQRVERLVREGDLTDRWQSRWRIAFLHLVALLAITTVIVAAPSVRATSPMNSKHWNEPAFEAPSTLNTTPGGSVTAVNGDAASSDFEAWSRLDEELQSLLSDLEIARKLASVSGTHANEIETLSAMAAAIESRRNQISAQFGTGKK
ncbi:MAG: M56 family metallopeptidase [Planctomycetota bacterium]